MIFNILSGGLKGILTKTEWEIVFSPEDLKNDLNGDQIFKKENTVMNYVLVVF